MSERISRPTKRCSLGSLKKKLVTLLSVNAFRTPPRFSISLDMSSCVRVLVPVNTRCSITCAIPLISSVSQNAPNLFDMLNDTRGKSLGSCNNVIPFDSFFFISFILVRDFCAGMLIKIVMFGVYLLIAGLDFCNTELIKVLLCFFIMPINAGYEYMNAEKKYT